MYQSSKVVQKLKDAGSIPGWSTKTDRHTIGVSSGQSIPSNIPLPSGLVKSGEALRYKFGSTTYRFNMSFTYDQ